MKENTVLWYNNPNNERDQRRSKYNSNMMRKFARTNALVLFLVILTTIDASRLFYLPLPKIHSSHDYPLDSSPSVQEEKILRDEFIPNSAMERHMYETKAEPENNQSNLSGC